MRTVHFPVTIPYGLVPGIRGVQPAAEVNLRYGSRMSNTTAIFDSGSVYTAFTPEHARVLEMRIRKMAGAPILPLARGNV